MISLTIEVRLPGDDVATVTLRATAAGGTLAVADDKVEFALPADAHVYLTSKEDTKFAIPPRQTTLQLEPATTYTLRGDASLAGGQVVLWLIEYDERDRLGHHKQALRGGEFALSWTTAKRHRACCLALRISGTGYLRLGPLSLSTRSACGDEPTPAVGHAPGSVQTGPQGRFQAYSIFFDPAGYKAYVERHHRFYDDRRPDWYERLTQPFAGCSSVLDIGCGPGLLLEALRSAGVADVVGLERDPFYLQTCRSQGLPVYEHDLNQPFPFIESDRFEGIVAHSSFDYLAPIAVRTVLRECRRVLKPGGLLFVVARLDGQASGDETRCSVPLDPRHVRQLLHEAGFAQADISTRKQRIEITARPLPDTPRWETRSIVLQSNDRVYPWCNRQAILPPSDNAWDNGSTRDFTLLTTTRKDEIRVAEQLVAYYTGYHSAAGQTQRAICRCVSTDGITWRREPDIPVLEAGEPGAWDDAGVAAGSVIRMPVDGRTRYAMYFSGRTPAGGWPGIGIAHSDDGIHWEKQPERILAVEEYPGLKYLALADVIQTSTGRWLMHCEGWIEEHGWSICQAESNDGFAWRPTQRKPILHPRDIPWGGRHVANPKCLEIADGHFVLGFNAADDSGTFQLALAESDDACHWRQLDVNPVICTTTGDHRIESMFITRDAWRRVDRRVYFFSAASKNTHLSSRVCLAQADHGADWPAGPWETTRWGLYHIRADQLIAQPGASDPRQALSRVVPLDRETQCIVRLAPESAGAGTVTLALEGHGKRYELQIAGDGRVVRDSECFSREVDDGAGTAVCLRIARPYGAQTEAVLSVWRGERQTSALHELIAFAPERLRIRVQVPTGEPPLVVDHIDIWQPDTLQVEGHGDAHMHMGVCRTDDDLLPDIDREAFRTLLRQHRISRVLVTTYGSRRRLDSFDQISPLTKELRGCIFPLIRVREPRRPRETDDQFRVLQLELLWQRGLLYGLKTHLNVPERPSPHVLQWVERRQLLTMWHVSCMADLEWLETHVLGRWTFPVLLSHFGGYPLDRSRYKACIDWLDRYPNLYLITSAVFFPQYIERAIGAHPDRILLGSDFPAVDPSVARAVLVQLDVPDEFKVLVGSENLRFLTERVAWQRWNLLRDGRDLLFPPLPTTPQELANQGFEIVAPADLLADEDAHAKRYWSQHVSPFYVEHKPWATVIAEMVHDLQPRSVLEFGCHVGRNLVAIRERVPGLRLVGLDINAAAVQAGREQNGLDLRCGNERTLADFADGEFDLVFTVSVLDHIPSIRPVCTELLPVEGKVVRHFDHKRGGVYPSTTASYSWPVDRYIVNHPRVWRLDCRPCYLHASSLGPYYVSYLAFLEPSGDAASGGLGGA